MTGKTDEYGEISGPIANSRLLSRNEWDFKVISLSITPLIEAIDEVYEFGCSLSTSSCYNYDLNRFVEKNTPITVRHIKLKKFETQTVEFSESIPWIRVDNDNDKINLTIFEAGTGIPLPEGSLAVAAHIMIKRIK